MAAEKPKHAVEVKQEEKQHKNSTSYNVESSLDSELEISPRERHKEVFVSAFHITCAVMGGGMLGLPYALSMTGWVGGMLFLLPICSLLMAYTGVLLYRCMMRVPHVHTYIDLGEAAAGKWGRWIIATAQLVSCFGSAVLLLVVGGQNMNDLVRSNSISLQMWLTICSGAVYPAIFAIRLKEAMAVSLFGVLSAMLAGIVVSLSCAVMGPEDSVVYNSEVSVKSFTTAFGTIMLAFGSHTVFPRVQREMPIATQRFFQKSIFISFPIISLFYATVGALGYMVYGDNVQDNVLKNMSHGIVYYTATISITVHVLMAYVIFLNPLFQIAEFYFGIGPVGRYRLEQIGTEAEVKATPDVVEGDLSIALTSWTKSDRLKSVFLRTILQGLTLFVAVLIPFFGDIMSFLGGSSITITCVVCPTWFYLRLYSRNEVGGWIFVYGHILLAGVGMAVGLCSTIFSLENIIKNASKYKLFGADS